MNETPNDRASVARLLREHKMQVAGQVTEEFLGRHPDWLTRYGARARPAGVEDAAYHVEFLATAVEAGSPAAFADYVRWTRGVLEARGIAAHFLKENLEQIRDALVRRLPATAGATVSRYIVDAAMSAEPESPPAETDHQTGLGLTCRVFVDAILSGQRKAAITLALEAFQAGCPIADVYADVLQAALYEVGRRWEANRITVADEHMATAITQYVMGQIYARMEMPRPTRGRILIAGVPGELHQLGANMVADVLEAHGWDVRFLGTNVPQPSILAAVEKHAPDVVGLSATMLVNLPKVREVAAAIRDRASVVQPRLVVGGAAFRVSGTLWKDMGADCFVPDLRAAVHLLC